MSRPLTLGKTRSGKPAVLSETERSTHLHIVGGSSRGKSKLLESLVRQDIIEGRGLCLIDPDGHLFEWITAWCAENNLGTKRKIVILDPHVRDQAFGFNPLRVDGDLSAHAEAMQSACAQVWGGENMHDTPSLNIGLRSVFYALAYHKLTLVEALSLLTATDPHNVRHRLTEQLTDPFYRSVWERYNTLRPQQFDEQLGSTYRRLFEFLDAPLVRAIVGQREHVIDFRKCMDEGAIVLVNLQRKGALTDGKARLLGTLIVNDLFQKALARPQGARPFTLYIDECTDYLNSDIAKSIDRARKFGLRLVLSHQRLGQLEKEGKDDILNAVMSVQSKIVFGGLEVNDAKRMAEELFSSELNLNAAKKKFATPMVVDYTIEWLSSEGTSRGSSVTESESETTGTGESRSASVSESSPLNNTWQLFAPPTGTQSVASGRTTFLTEQSSTSRAETASYAENTGQHQTFRPVLEKGPGIPKSLEELVHEAMVRLKDLPQQSAIFKPIGRRSVRIETPTIIPSVASEKRVDDFVAGVLERSGFSALYDTVTKEIEERLRTLGAPSEAVPLTSEPEHFREPIRAPAKAPAPRARRAK